MWVVTLLKVCHQSCRHISESLNSPPIAVFTTLYPSIQLKMSHIQQPGMPSTGINGKFKLQKPRQTNTPDRAMSLPGEGSRDELAKTMSSHDGRRRKRPVYARISGQVHAGSGVTSNKVSTQLQPQLSIPFQFELMRTADVKQYRLLACTEADVVRLGFDFGSGLDDKVKKASQTSRRNWLQASHSSRLENQ